MSKVNLPSLYRGIGFNGTYTHVEPMTGGTLYFTIKDDEFDGDTSDTSATPQKTITSFINNDMTATWKVTDQEMYLEPGTYFYDIIYEGADGQSYPPVFTGKFKLIGHATNRNTVNG